MQGPTLPVPSRSPPPQTATIPPSRFPSSEDHPQSRSAILLLTVLLLPWSSAAVEAPLAQTPRPTPPTRDPHTPGYVKATQLPDGQVPPPTADGNFILGPTHPPAPQLAAFAAQPHHRGEVSQFAHGSVTVFTMTSAESRIYPGIALVPGIRGRADPNDPTKVSALRSRSSGLFPVEPRAIPILAETNMEWPSK